MMQKTISFSDVENFSNWLEYYFSKINSDVNKNILDFSIQTWLPVLKELTSEDLTNGVRNISLIIQKNQEEGVIQFPISSRVFRNLCKQNFFNGLQCN